MHCFLEVKLLDRIVDSKNLRKVMYQLNISSIVSRWCRWYNWDYMLGINVKKVPGKRGVEGSYVDMCFSRDIESNRIKCK